MESRDLLTLLDHWSVEPGPAAHGRLAALLVARGADEPALAKESLGERNRRLIALHDDWAAGEIEARVACTACTTANSFSVPKAAMRALPPPPPDAGISVEHGGRSLRYRLPTMADIAVVAGIGDMSAMRAAMIDRCALDSDGVPASQLDAATIDAIEAEFDRLDPLASIVVESACSDCAAAIAARVDLAAFVAADVDRIHAALLRDIDAIASAYGWTEATIVALPADRRARYVAMIADRRAGQAQRTRRVALR